MFAEFRIVCKETATTMSKVKLCISVLFLVLKIREGLSVTNEELGKTTEILFNLTNYAIESRRIRNPCQNEVNDYNYFKCVKLLMSSHNQPSNYAHGSHYYAQKPHNYRPYPYRYPYPNLQPQNPQSVMDILYTIATNDVLRCVPRLLCEATSDTISRSRQGLTIPTLPFKIDMGSIIKMLSIIDLPGGSPIPVFAKAALLGYVSKGNSDSCLEAYPKCPNDPNKLVQYLNNYNGGFFRYFNGVNRPTYAQKRIQNNKPTYSATHNVIFVDKEVFSNNNRAPKRLSFPSEDYDNRFNEFTFKKPKELPFSISEYYANELDLQKPLPNHKVTPMIFPDRTGTGELRLDAEELSGNYKQTEYNFENNDFVRFIPTRPNEGFYYEVPRGEFDTNKAIFSFPV